MVYNQRRNFAVFAHRGGRMKSIRLVIVDDHGLVRIGLRTVAEAEGDLAVVGDYGRGALDDYSRLTTWRG